MDPELSEGGDARGTEEMGSDTDEEGKTQKGAREARIRGCLSPSPPSWSRGPSPHTASQGAHKQGANPDPKPSFQSPLVKNLDPQVPAGSPGMGLGHPLSHISPLSL